MSKYENHDLQKKTLPFIFKEMEARGTELRFGASNWHENVEILHIISGAGAVSNNGKVIPVFEGDTAIIDKNRLHAIASQTHSMKYRYLIVDRSFCIENGFDTNGISFEPKICDGRVTAIFRELIELYALGEGDPYKALSIRTRVLDLMLLLCREYSQREDVDEYSDGGAYHIKRALEYINANYARDISLDEVSDYVGISKYYLSHEFNKYVGYSFVSYVNYTRCNRAKRLLSEGGLSVLQVASSCGFRSCSYFAKCFLKYAGVLPGEYRAGKLEK